MVLPSADAHPFPPESCFPGSSAAPSSDDPDLRGSDIRPERPTGEHLPKGDYAPDELELEIDTSISRSGTSDSDESDIA